MYFINMLNILKSKQNTTLIIINLFYTDILLKQMKHLNLCYRQICYIKMIKLKPTDIQINPNGFYLLKVASQRNI